jgi:lactate dehydrogenase-like 2-hydroxyacid dehydrogenase
LTDAAEARLREEYAVTPLWEQVDREAFLAREGASFRVLVTAGGAKVEAGLIAALPSLQVIATRGVGTDHIDLVDAKTQGIVVCNTPEVLTDCVADLAFGAVIAVARQLTIADRFIRRGDWLKERFPLTTRVSRKCLGIVGLGRIGQAVARRATGFEMEVRYHSRTMHPEKPAGYCPSLLRLAEWADFLVVCVPGGNATRKLISAKVLTALGSDGYLINVARGSVVDEEALVNALMNGIIAGAALDVFEKEPNVPEKLLALNNVLLLPHIASSTRETFDDMEALLLDNLHSFFARGKLLTEIVED